MACSIFVSYAHADEKLKNSKARSGEGYPRTFLHCLKTMLNNRPGLVSPNDVFFDGNKLNAEREWNKAIEDALTDCKLFIFLVSMNSMGSEYCLNKELATAAARGVAIVPVVLTPWRDWAKFEVKDPTNGKPLGVLGQYHSAGLPKDSGGNCLAVSNWDREADAWDEVCAGLWPILETVFGNKLETKMASDAVPEPWPEWPPDEAAFLDECRQRLVRCFADPILRSHLGFIFTSPDHRLPSTLHEALSGMPMEVGQAVCIALLNLTDDLTARLKERSLAFSRGDYVLLADRLKTAMGAGARMCLDPKVLEELGLGTTADTPTPTCRRVPASEVAGATLALREEPHKTWKKSSGVNAARLDDSCAIPVPIEFGDKVSVEKGLAALAFAHIYPGKDVPADMDPTTIDRMRGDLNLAAIRKFTRYFVFPENHTSLLTPEQETWVINRLATGVLVLQSGASSQPLFRYDERNLLSLINAFLNVFDEPEWNPS